MLPSASDRDEPLELLLFDASHQSHPDARVSVSAVRVDEPVDHPPTQEEGLN